MAVPLRAIQNPCNKATDSTYSPKKMKYNITELMNRIEDKKVRRKSIEILLDKCSPRRVTITMSENGSYGFNLRGSLAVRGHAKQRGQYVRSVDFNGPAHEWGLRAGDRLLAVNGEECEDESHENVIAMIKKTRRSKNLELVVVTDANMKETAVTATTGLLKSKAREVLNEKTGIPHFTVEMTESALGRTRMLQRKIFGSPGGSGLLRTQGGDPDWRRGSPSPEPLNADEIKALSAQTDGRTPSPLAEENDGAGQAELELLAPQSEIGVRTPDNTGEKKVDDKPPNNETQVPKNAEWEQLNEGEGDDDDDDGGGGEDFWV